MASVASDIMLILLQYDHIRMRQVFKDIPYPWSMNPAGFRVPGRRTATPGAGTLGEAARAARGGARILRRSALGFGGRPPASARGSGADPARAAGEPLPEERERAVALPFLEREEPVE